MPVSCSRRDALRGLAASGAAAFCFASDAAVAQAAPRFRSISIDVSPIASRGVPRYAAVVRQALEGPIREQFADRLAPTDKSAPALVVRVKSLDLASYAGGSSGNFLNGGSSFDKDEMEGEGLVVGPRGAVLQSYPILSSLNAGASGAWYLPDNEARRVTSISQHFAYWLRRRIG